MSITLADMEGPGDQTDNMGGTTQRFYWAYKSEFLSLKEPVPGSTPESLVEITTAHTFKTGGFFREVYCTMDKGTGGNKTQGDTDGVSFKQEYEFVYPGSESAAHGFAATIKNGRLIILVEMPDSATGGYLQLGNAMFQAKIKPEFTVATGSSGLRGHTFKIECMASAQAIYKSTISRTPAP